ncbi:MAG: MBL fold metallo-hydrolase [Actinomycetes bacterium]
MVLPTTTWMEVGAGCFARRYASFDVTVGVVLGDAGAVVIDTRSSMDEGDELLDDLRRLGVGAERIRAVVNTHGHFDHCFGNARFPPCPLWGHALLPRYLRREAPTMRAFLADRGPEWAAEMDRLEVRVPDHLVAHQATIDLGDRLVELVCTGRGHTDHDLVVVVPTAEVAYVGDLLEESGPPSYGPDCFPLDWPDTLDALRAILTGSDDPDRQPAGPTRLVPGHGNAVGMDFFDRQHAEIRTVADIISRLLESSPGLEDAWQSDEPWPYPPEMLAEALRRAFEQQAGG